MSGEGDSIGDSVRAAYDKHEGGSTQDAPAPVAEVQAAPEPAGEPVEALDAEAAPADEAKPAEAQAKPAPSAKAPVAKPAPVAAKPPTAKPAPANGAPAAATPASPEPAKAAGPELKAPQSWRPAVREKWAALDPDVRSEVVRREKEMTHAHQQNAQHKHVSERFQETVNPYLAMIQAEGADPYKAVGSLLQTAAALRTAPPQYRAQLVAGLVQQFSIPIDALDAALAGQAPPQGQQQQAPMDPEALLRQAEQRAEARMMERLKQQSTTLAQSKANQEMEAFLASGDTEFLDDVRETMGILMSAASQRGVALPLRDAYNLAVQQHPELSKVLQSRQQQQAQAQQATATQAATTRAKAAASSVQTRPVGGAPAKPTSLRGDIEAAMGALSGR
ncbi:hypothetical protein [Myxococcus landrumensis]|uniref:Uncharacterized protein n=1 Tax=Myxococcus landrumensis TaxID=2813577 RepID=A0ABX7N5P6_9BACT|nr:hypothetical protein [Myxococcus landrumus]QSQ14051.1 hypothetical protein JY572_38015 [Myxococcus landrumus]